MYSVQDLSSLGISITIFESFGVKRSSVTFLNVSRTCVILAFRTTHFVSSFIDSFGIPIFCSLSSLAVLARSCKYARKEQKHQPLHPLCAGTRTYIWLSGVYLLRMARWFSNVCLRVRALPSGPEWMWMWKNMKKRCIAVKNNKHLDMFSLVMTMDLILAIHNWKPWDLRTCGSDQTIAGNSNKKAAQRRGLPILDPMSILFAHD